MKCTDANKLINEVIKEAMPQVPVKGRGNVDLYFEFLSPKDRKTFWEDLTSKDSPEISLADFGHLGENYFIDNSVKTISREDLPSESVDFIKLFVNDKREPLHPFLEYDKQQHKIKLKPKYDLKKIIEDIESESVPA